MVVMRVSGAHHGPMCNTKFSKVNFSYNFDYGGLMP